eukprot:ANDGO_04134.mRNA.1 hypothetical protein
MRLENAAAFENIANRLVREMHPGTQRILGQWMYGSRAHYVSDFIVQKWKEQQAIFGWSKAVEYEKEETYDETERRKRSVLVKDSLWDPPYVEYVRNRLPEEIASIWKDTDCGICLLDESIDGQIQDWHTLRCGHSFHLGCEYRMLATRYTIRMCPKCTKAIELDESQQIFKIYREKLEKKKRESRKEAGRIASCLNTGKTVAEQSPHCASSDVDSKVAQSQANDDEPALQESASTVPSEEAFASHNTNPQDHFCSEHTPKETRPFPHPRSFPEGPLPSRQEKPGKLTAVPTSPLGTGSSTENTKRSLFAVQATPSVSPSACCASSQQGLGADAAKEIHVFPRVWIRDNTRNRYIHQDSKIITSHCYTLHVLAQFQSTDIPFITTCKIYDSKQLITTIFLVLVSPNMLYGEYVLPPIGICAADSCLQLSVAFPNMNQKCRWDVGRIACKNRNLDEEHEALPSKAGILGKMTVHATSLFARARGQSASPTTSTSTSTSPSETETPHARPLWTLGTCLTLTEVRNFNRREA